VVAACVVGSIAATALVAARGVLFEWRPITSNVVNLSALTGARAGMAGDALMTRKKSRG
jgi:hypothetical protein